MSKQKWQLPNFNTLSQIAYNLSNTQYTPFIGSQSKCYKSKYPYSISGYTNQSIRYSKGNRIEHRQIGICSLLIDNVVSLLKAIKRNASVKLIDEFDTLRLKLEKQLNASIRVTIVFNTDKKGII